MPLQGKSGKEDTEDMVEARTARGLWTAHASAWSPTGKRAADVPTVTGHSAHETGCKPDRACSQDRGWGGGESPTSDLCGLSREGEAKEGRKPLTKSPSCAPQG